MMVVKPNQRDDADKMYEASGRCAYIDIYFSYSHMCR